MNQVQNELRHYGVLGMKWGKRKAQVSAAIDKRKAKETEFRQKLTNIQKNNPNMVKSDIARFEYRNRSLASRIGTQATVAITGTVLKNVMNNMLFGKKPDVKSIKRDAVLTSLKMAKNLVKDDALAKSAAKRYDSNGKVIKKSGLLTKEDWIESGINVAEKAAVVGMYVGGKKMFDAKKNRAANEARFNAWGPNVLNKSIDRDILWVNDSGDMSVIQERKTK